jgi:excisionase family DNA binding protein
LFISLASFAILIITIKPGEDMGINLIDLESAIPSNKEAALAEKSSRILSDYIRTTKTLTLQLVDNKKENKKIVLPPQALLLLVGILEQMSQGNAISLIPIHAELTTQEAADLLNVSRPYLINLLNEGKIPFRKVGTKRRVLAEDVLRYKTAIDKKRFKTLEALMKQAQELDMGY